MPDFSALVPETHRNISPGYVETLFQARREELFTGLMRLSYSSGENLVFTFLDGFQQKLYRFLENTTDVFPRQAWPNVAGSSIASAGCLHLPVEAMRFVRVAHEAPVVRVENEALASEELADAAGKWAVEANPRIVYVQGEKVNRYYLIAGHSGPIIEELSFMEGEARFSIGDASFLYRLPRSTYQVTGYISDREHDVWREHELRLAFNPLMRMLLNRFSELAGHALTERLCQQLSQWAHEGGWKLTLNSNGVVNRQFFDFLEIAVVVYVDLLRRFRQEASLAIGSRMVDGISHEILIKLDPYRRELLTNYIYSQFGVGSVTGGARR